MAGKDNDPLTSEEVKQASAAWGTVKDGDEMDLANWALDWAWRLILTVQQLQPAARDYKHLYAAAEEENEKLRQAVKEFAMVYHAGHSYDGTGYTLPFDTCEDNLCAKARVLLK